MWEEVNRAVSQAGELIDLNLRLLQEDDGPYMYEDAVRSDEMLVEDLKNVCSLQNFDQCALLLQNMKFTSLSRKKDETVSDRKREQVKENRDRMKEILKELK